MDRCLPAADDVNLVGKQFLAGVMKSHNIGEQPSGKSESRK
jgi:hypothetical protein